MKNCHLVMAFAYRKSLQFRHAVFSVLVSVYILPYKKNERGGRKSNLTSNLMTPRFLLDNVYRPFH